MSSTANTSSTLRAKTLVAGIRTPQQITKAGSLDWAHQQGISEEVRASLYPSMEEAMPEIYAELDMLQQRLEAHYKDMQDMEFTVQDGKLWFLQTRMGSARVLRWSRSLGSPSRRSH